MASTARGGVAKSVVGGNTCAEQRGGIFGAELVRNGSNATSFSEHHLRVSSIDIHTQHHGVLTIHHVPASAWFACPVFAGNQADTDPLTDFPFGHSVAQRLNATNYFMSRNPWQVQTGVGAGYRGLIGMTDSTGFNADQNLSLAGLGNWPFNNPKVTGRRDFDCFVGFCHFVLSSECELQVPRLTTFP